MSLPKEAKLEKVLPGGVAIYDVSHLLPEPANPRYDVRPNGIDIIRVFFHHSGAYGNDGFRGALGSVRYVIQQRNFGAPPYHFWLSYKPDVDENGNIVIYRLGKDEKRCWHTGARANDNGVGVAWQGNLSPGGTGKPSDEQYKMAEALTGWLIGRYNLELPDGLSFHSEAKKWGARKNKRSCPGPYVEKWVKERRERVAEGKSAEEPVEVEYNEEKDKRNPESGSGLGEPQPGKDKKEPAPQEKKGWFWDLIKTWLSNLFPGKK